MATNKNFSRDDLNYVGGKFMKLPSRIENIIIDACKGTHIDPNLMCRICCVESGGDPKAYRDDTKVGGLFQFKVDTAAKYGLSANGRFDPVLCAKAAVAHMEDIYEKAKDILGREPRSHELYVCHQQGEGGGPALLANLERNAIDVLKGCYRKNPGYAVSAIIKNGGKAWMTAKDFIQHWAGVFGESVAHPSPGRRQGLNDEMSSPEAAAESVGSTSGGTGFDDPSNLTHGKLAAAEAGLEPREPQREQAGRGKMVAPETLEGNPDHTLGKLAAAESEPEGIQRSPQEKHSPKERRAGHGRKHRVRELGDDNPAIVRPATGVASVEGAAAPSSVAPVQSEAERPKNVFAAIAGFFAPEPGNATPAVDTSALKAGANAVKAEAGSSAPVVSPSAPPSRPLSHQFGFGNQ